MERLSKLEPDWQVLIPFPDNFETFTQIDLGDVYKHPKKDGFYYLHPWQNPVKKDLVIEKKEMNNENKTNSNRSMFDS